MVHWTLLIDFDLKIMICHAEVACTNFYHFEGMEKYQSEVSIPEIGIETMNRKVSILQNGYHGQISKSIDTWIRYRKVSIPERGIDIQH